jgi:hypothetical protein
LPASLPGGRPPRAPPAARGEEAPCLLAERRLPPGQVSAATGPQFTCVTPGQVSANAGLRGESGGKIREAEMKRIRFGATK